MALDFLSKQAEAVITQNVLVSLSFAEAKKATNREEKKNETGHQSYN